MAKGKRASRGPKSTNAPKGGKNGTVLPLKSAVELKLTEVELLKIQNNNLVLAKLNSDKNALNLQMRETDRAGKEAQGNMSRHLATINKRLGIDIQQFEIQGDGSLVPKQAAPQPSARTKNAKKKE